VTLDSEGNLWAADYQDGRVQQFDPSGKFLQLIQVPPDKNETPIEGWLPISKATYTPRAAAIF
jgi:hypothetical protein